MNINDVTSSSSSSTSSIYGSRNVLSGLASGMDTEAIIKNSVSGYQTKIESLEKEKTTIEWKQEAYRSIIDKMNDFADKYTSFTSATNLNSNTFFENYTTTATGDNGGKVYATGKTDNDVKINSISQLATGDTYKFLLSDAKSSSTLRDLGFVEDGEQELVINGVSIGSYGADTKLSTIVSDINKNTSAGAKASFSNVTGELTIVSNKTGDNSSLTIGDSFLNFLKTDDKWSFTHGHNAEFSATVNGTTVTLSRDSNTVDLDGLKVTLRDTFNSGEAIGFNTQTNTEPIISTIKSFIEDYNAIQNELHSAYTTKPLEKSGSSHGKYEPLSESDKEGMSESTIAAYEKKAKAGLLYMDSDLSAAYERMRMAINDGGTEKALNDIGIKVKYSNYTTTLELDETKLKDALETNVDSVKKVFMGEEGGNKGMISSLQSTVKTYANLSSGSRGILVQKAGSEKGASSLLDNDLQKRLNQLDEKISDWQSKMNVKIDYYTTQFTALEKMISQMNNQSSMLSGLTG